MSLNMIMMSLNISIFNPPQTLTIYGDIYLSCQQSIMTTIHAHGSSKITYSVSYTSVVPHFLRLEYFVLFRGKVYWFSNTVYHLKDKSNCFPQTPTLSTLSQWTNHWALMNKPTNHVSVATYIYFHCYHYWSSCVIVELDCILLSLLKRTLFFQNPPDLIRFHFYCYFQLLFGRKRYFAKS